MLGKGRRSFAMDCPAYTPCYCTTLRRAARAVTAFYDHSLKECGLRVTQLSLLAHVQRLGPVPLHTLGEAMKLERTTLVRNLQALEARQLVQRHAGSGKAHMLELSAEGERVLREARPLWERTQQRMHAALNDEERAALAHALRRLEELAP